MDDSPEQLPTTPLAPSISGSPHKSSAAFTPAASLQAPGSGSNPLVSAKGSSSQPLLAAALARASEEHSPSPHTRSAGKSPARAPALLASVAGAAAPDSPRSQASLRLVASATQEAATVAAAGNLAQARNPSLSSVKQPAALSQQEDATSSASFDSWRSRNREDSTATAHSSKPADATAVGPSRHSGSRTPAAASAIDAQGRSHVFWFLW